MSNIELAAAILAGLQWKSDAAWLRERPRIREVLKSDDPKVQKIMHLVCEQGFKLGYNARFTEESALDPVRTAKEMLEAIKPEEGT